MTSTATALNEFFSGFGLLAFPEYYVPEQYPDEHGDMQPVTLPYITYQVIEPDWRDSGSFYARVWYRSTSYAAINAKVDQISAAIGEGISLRTDSGAVYLTKGTPFMQYMPMEGDDTLKVAYLSFSIQAITR